MGSLPDSDRGLRFRWLTARRAMEMPLRPNVVVWYLVGGRGLVKHLQIAISCVARAMCGVTETDCSCTANIITSSLKQGSSVLNQVMIASRLTSPVVIPDYYSKPYDQTVDYGPTTCPSDEEVIVIPEKFRHIFYNDGCEFAGMANPNHESDEEDVSTFGC